MENRNASDNYKHRTLDRFFIHFNFNKQDKLINEFICQCEYWNFSELLEYGNLNEMNDGRVKNWKMDKVSI
jgi:hypothetical protein